MQIKGTVAIVGRPNVGKSTLFNRIIRNRTSIVDDKPGATRDRIYATAEWLTRGFSIIDTGGITLDKADFSKEITAQADIAIAESDVIIFVISYKEGVTKDEEIILRKLYKSTKPVILAINKYDKSDPDFDKYQYMSLGLDEPILISAAHGIGIGDLLDKIVFYLDKEKTEPVNRGISFSIIGKPNVGKSSLTNALVNENRTIVSDIAGTTTDAIDASFQWHNQKYTVVDTAGIRRRGKIYEKLEKYSVLRAHKAIENSEIVLLLVDGTLAISDQDTNIAGIAHNQNKPVIIVVNKWDAVAHKTEHTMIEKEKEIRSYFKYLSYAKIVFISALENQRINKLLETITTVYDNQNLRVSTSIINEILVKAQLLNPPPSFNGGRLKIYYATQPKSKPPTFILFVNDPTWVHFSYKRFLINQIRHHFDFDGVPIKLIFRERK